MGLIDLLDCLKSAINLNEVGGRLGTKGQFFVYAPHGVIRVFIFIA